MRNLKHAKLEKALREKYVTKKVMIDSLLNQKSVFKNRKMKFQHFHFFLIFFFNNFIKLIEFQVQDLFSRVNQCGRTYNIVNSQGLYVVDVSSTLSFTL